MGVTPTWRVGLSHNLIVDICVSYGCNQLGGTEFRHSGLLLPFKGG